MWAILDEVATACVAPRHPLRRALEMDATMQIRLEYDLVCGAIKRFLPSAELPTLTQFAESIDHRNIDGSGFVTVFGEEKFPRVFAATLNGDVNQCGGSLDGGVEHAGFVVMVEHGRLMWIEGFTYSGNEWPQFETFELSTIRANS